MITYIEIVRANIFRKVFFVSLKYLSFVTGEQVTIQVLRTKSAQGSVSVDWEIQGLNGLLPKEGFLRDKGTLMFFPVI